MKTYLVGGAVRDHLLGLAVKERDWVVVGATVDDMLAQNFQQVGKDFPVFLHPETKEEYALARTERKQGSGYTGFAIHASPDVTLEQDLNRRDLTINAIAQDDAGRLIDPCNGLADINNRLLRHISDAFIEDPLRVLRVARFHAKLAHLGFQIAAPTLALMQQICASGELNTLSPERIWTEIHKGLSENSPHTFILTLYQSGAMEHVLPELNNCFHNQDNMLAVSASIGDRTLAALKYAAQHQFSTLIRWAVVLHAIDQSNRPKNLAAKVITEKAEHADVVKRVGQRLRTPNDHTELAQLTAYYIDFAISARTAKPDLIISLLDVCDAWRRPERFYAFLQSCEALISTSPEQSHQNLGAIALLRTAYTQCAKINGKEFLAAGISGEAIGDSIRNARKVCVAELKQQF